LLIVGIMSFLVNSNTEEQSSESFLISYVEHEGLIKYYVPLLEQAYEKIGISPTFVLVNDQRALRLLDAGQLDADTAKSLESIDQYSNVIYLPEPISKIEVYFICQAELVCDKSVLQQEYKSLAVIGAQEFYSELLVGTKIQLVELTSFDVVFRMFEQQKVDVAIVVLDAYTKPKLERYPNHYKITEKLGYHLLHKEHANLTVPLSRAIQETLKENNFVK